ncbi:hypothetical protein [Sulfurimonas diazotrophicus]|uniref:Lipoprotein n=1 Tax=Sulfurimonas diazotrophicus TaxID=3131939 RepID=A0ABZ3H7R8_9BACT
MLIQIRYALAALVAVSLTSCATGPSPSASAGAKPTQKSAPPKTAGDLDPMYRPLGDVDLSQYKSAGNGLLLVARKGDYDILLTKPGYPYELPAMGWSGINYHKATRNVSQFSGYMMRARNNGNNPLPYIGRQVFVDIDGVAESYYGSFAWNSFKQCLFCSRDTIVEFVEGIPEVRDTDGKVLRMPYKINRYWEYWYQFNSGNYVWHYVTNSEQTSRKIQLRPASHDQKPVYTEVSGLPQYEFVLPHPEQVAANFPSTDRALFTRTYSLGDLLRQKKINPDNLLLKPFSPTSLRDNFNKSKIHKYDHAWISHGQSAFVSSPMTGKTYLQPYQKPPVLTLPSLKEIVMNGKLSVNRQCMGKTDGMVVLTGQCDPASPVFPLTVMTQISANQFVVNVWSDINRRSSYLLTGGQFPKQNFYRWNIDAFMVNTTVDPDTTLAALETGDDPFSEKIIAFANQNQDRQVCDKMATAVSNAEKALHFDPDIEERLAKYEHYYKMDWADMGKAISNIDRNPKHTPVTDFEEFVWDDLVSMRTDIDQRLNVLNRYKDVNNSVCQPDPQRMTQLVTALTSFKADLRASMKQLDDTYYDQAVERKKEIYYWANRLEEAKKQAAMAQFMDKLHASLNADLAAKQAERRSMTRSILESRRAVKAQIADVKARNAAYFANHKPAVSAPSAVTIAPVTMPSYSLDTTADSKVYLGGLRSNRLSFQDAIAQSKIKTAQLKQTTTGTAPNATAATPSAESAPEAKPSRDAPGGAAICVAVSRNASNNMTDLGYYYAYDQHSTPLKTDRVARQKYAAEHNGTPSCKHNDEDEVGALVVVVWDGKDYTGAASRTYGMGFGLSTGAAEMDAVNNLSNRNWSWKPSMGYRVVFAKQY